MSKRHLIIVISSTIVILAPTKIAIGQGNSICYMEDSKAVYLDLSKICGKSPTPNSSTSPPTPMSNGIDGKPSTPPAPISPNIQLVPNQTQKPPIVLRNNSSPLWNLIPDLPTPLEQLPPIK